MKDEHIIGGCGKSLFPHSTKGFVRGKFPNDKLWDHLGKREKLNLRSTKAFNFIPSRVLLNA